MINREKPHIYRQKGQWEWEMACEVIGTNGGACFKFERNSHSELNFQALEFVERLNQK